MTKTAKCINDDDTRIGQNLVKLRKAKGMSQEHLAEFIGLTFQQVQKYEKAQNRISISMGLKICRALNITISDLVGDVQTSPVIQNLTEVENLKAKIKAARDALA